MTRAPPPPPFLMSQLWKKQAQLSWDWLRVAQLSNSILTQIDLAQKGQLREAQLAIFFLTQIGFPQKSLSSCYVLKSR